MQLDDNIQYSYFLFDENDRAFIEDLASFIMTQTNLQSLVSKYRIQHANDLLLLRKWPITNISYNRSVTLFTLLYNNNERYLVITKDSAEKYQYCCFIADTSLKPVIPDIITKELLYSYYIFHIQGNINMHITYRAESNRHTYNREHIKLLIGRHQIYLYNTNGLIYYPNNIHIPVPSTLDIKLIHPEHGKIHLTTTFCKSKDNNNDNATYYASIQFESRNDRHYEDFYKDTKYLYTSREQ
jgi:hypothetical protein